MHRDEKFHLKKHTVVGDKLSAVTGKQYTFDKERAQTISLNEEDSKLFQKQVQLAMLKGQYSEKKEIVETQGGSNTRNQEDLEQLYIKAAEMKVKHLLEVIDRQQDQLSNIGTRYEQLETSVEEKEEFLDKTIKGLRLRAKGMIGSKLKERQGTAEAEAPPSPKGENRGKKRSKKSKKGKTKKVTDKGDGEGKTEPKSGASMDKIVEEEEGDEGGEENDEVGDEKEDNDEDKDEADEEENNDRRKEWNKEKAEREIEEKMKENEAMERENQVLMEQLERVTNFKAGASSGGDTLQEVILEGEKVSTIESRSDELRRGVLGTPTVALKLPDVKVANSDTISYTVYIKRSLQAHKMRTIKENRLRRLNAAHEEKKFNVENARGKRRTVPLKRWTSILVPLFVTSMPSAFEVFS